MKGRRGYINPPYKRIAKDIGQRIRGGEIPDGTILLGREITDQYGAAGESVSNIIRILKTEGLVESKKTVKRGRGGIRNFVKSPENPQGGSPERR